MSSISELTDFSELNGQHICYHNVNVKAHHVEMENVLGTSWSHSADDKCKTVWAFTFRDDNGEFFPVYVYDWKEHDDYYRFTNHYYHIGTRTAMQSKLVAEYIESKIHDFMEIVKSRFYFDKAGMVKKISEAIRTYCYIHSESEIAGVTIQIYNDGEIEIGNDIKISAKNVFEPVVMLLNQYSLSLGILECDLKKLSSWLTICPHISITNI